MKAEKTMTTRVDFKAKMARPPRAISRFPMMQKKRLPLSSFKNGGRQ